MSIRSRVTSSKRGMRRSHHKVGEVALTSDKKGNIHMRHRVSPTSGTYKGRQVIDVNKKLMKKAAKKQTTEGEVETKE